MTHTLIGSGSKYALSLLILIRQRRHQDKGKSPYFQAKFHFSMTVERRETVKVMQTALSYLWWK